jgi:hypothetical protein
MWAQEFNLTLLFSGANNPKTGQGGTGIFDCKLKRIQPVRR